MRFSHSTSVYLIIRVWSSHILFPCFLVVLLSKVVVKFLKMFLLISLIQVVLEFSS